MLTSFPPHPQNEDALHTISEQVRTEKPPEYETCVIAPPSYDVAIQLNPAFLPHVCQDTAVPTYEFAVRSSYDGGDSRQGPNSSSSSSSSNSSIVKIEIAKPESINSESSISITNNNNNNHSHSSPATSSSSSSSV